MTASPRWVQQWVTASDGTELAVYVAGPAGAPTVLCVHGYPDDHGVWNPVAADLSRDHRVIAYDVRGAGASDVPSGLDAYRAGQLADDLARVAAATTTGPVHLLAHDWGSVQAWAAVTTDGACERFRSLTSISGPDQAYAGVWLRRAWRDDRVAVLRQVASSWYIGMFLLPVLPRLLWASGLGTRLLPRSAPARSIPDAIHGLALYRANFAHRPGPRRCEIPVQLLVPRRDEYLTAPMVTEAPAPFVADLRTSEIDGGHWTFVAHPERVTAPVRAFLADLEAR